MSTPGDVDAGFEFERDATSDVSEQQRQQQQKSAARDAAHAKLKAKNEAASGKLLDTNPLLSKITDSLAEAFGASTGKVAEMKKEISSVMGDRGIDGMKDYLKEMKGKLSMVSKMGKTRDGPKTKVRAGMFSMLDTLSEQLERAGPDGELDEDGYAALEALGSEQEDFVPKDMLKAWALPEDLDMATGLLPNKAAYYMMCDKLGALKNAKAGLEALKGKATKKGRAKREKLTKKVAKLQAEVDVIQAQMSRKWEAAAQQFNMDKIQAIQKAKEKAAAAAATAEREGGEDEKEAPALVPEEEEEEFDL